MCFMTQNGHQNEMPKNITFVSWDWTLEVKMSQAYKKAEPKEERHSMYYTPNHMDSNA
jgi:hypothetical protein